MIPINIIYFKNNNVADENTDENIKEYIKEHISPGEFQGGKKLLNLGLYKDTSNVYADVLVGISRLRNKDWEICDSDTAICVTASAGDPILMLNTILNCSQLSNEILEGMLKPFIGPEKSWQDLENKMKKNDKNSSDNFLYGIISDEKEIDISLNPENNAHVR